MELLEKKHFTNLVAWCSDNALIAINKVTLCQAWLLVSAWIGDSAGK